MRCRLHICAWGQTPTVRAADHLITGGFLSAAAFTPQHSLKFSSELQEGDKL